MYQGNGLNLSSFPVRREQSQPAKVAPPPDYSGQFDALSKQIDVLDREKANASTVGGISTALGSTQDRVTALSKTIPVPATAVSPSESIGGAKGSADGRFSREDHQHPRLTSTTYATLGSNGQATVAFSRPFTNKPGLNLTETDAVASTQPLVIRGLAWQRDAQGLYTGVTIQGMRAQLLPQIAIVSGLLTAVITGVNSLIGALTNYNVFGGSAAGATVSVIAVARSDMPST